MRSACWRSSSLSKRMHNGVFRPVHRQTFEGPLKAISRLKRCTTRRVVAVVSTVLDNRCLGARARWKLKLKLPWNCPGLQGAGASHGVPCGYKRGGWCRETDKVATWYSMFCRLANLQLPSRHSSAVAAVRRRATGSPVLRQRAGPAGVNKTHHRHSTNPSGYAQHEQHSTHLAETKAGQVGMIHNSPFHAWLPEPSVSA